MRSEWLQAGSAWFVAASGTVETICCLPVYWVKQENKNIMYQKIIALCITAIISSLLTTTTGAVEAVRTEAVEAAVEKNRPASGSVTTETFTTAIVDGKPVDDQRAFENTVDTIYFYTVLE
ncbi:MAG TPA: hypothetical protein DDW55_09150, partial [Gammaproteobacteria bacterium]|nr:hypothetical protein [Gammaproteobacteria bacterium]